MRSAGNLGWTAIICEFCYTAPRISSGFCMRKTGMDRLRKGVARGAAMKRNDPLLHYSSVDDKR